MNSATRKKGRLRVLRGFDFPEPGSSLAMVKEAGGRQKLTEEQKKKLKLRRYEPGQFCDDLPEEYVAGAIASKTVELVEGETQTEQPTPKTTKKATKKAGSK